MSTNFRSANPVGGELDGSGMQVAIVCGRFNDLITNRLLDGALERLSELGVADHDRLDLRTIRRSNAGRRVDRRMRYGARRIEPKHDAAA